MVLLKNDNILPLRTCAGLVVLGDLQNYTVGGGSGRVVGRTVSLTDAFKTRCGFVEAYADLQSEKAQDAVATATNVLVVTGSQSTEGADRSTLALDGEALIEEAAKLNPSSSSPARRRAPSSQDGAIASKPSNDVARRPGARQRVGRCPFWGREPVGAAASDPTDDGETDLKFTQRMYPGLPDPEPPKGCADPCLARFYDEKLEVGYRRYDSHNIEPAYAFGHGRSYTSFVYGNLTVSLSRVTFDVRNIGGVAGAEVAQLYVAPAIFRGYQQLKGFHKTAVLAPGRVERVTLRFDARTFPRSSTAPGGPCLVRMNCASARRRATRACAGPSTTPSRADAATAWSLGPPIDALRVVVDNAPCPPNGGRVCWCAVFVLQRGQHGRRRANTWTSPRA